MDRLLAMNLAIFLDDMAEGINETIGTLEEEELDVESASSSLKDYFSQIAGVADLLRRSAKTGEVVDLEEMDAVVGSDLVIP